MYRLWRLSRKQSTTITVAVRNFLGGALLAAAIVGCGGGGGSFSSGSLQSPLAAAPNVVPPTGSIYLGAYANPTGAKPPPTSALAALETQVGRRFALAVHYYGFYDDFPGPYEADDSANGRMPIESWNCQVPNAAIAAGNADVLIKKRADALKAYGKPIFLRYMWEMNLPSSEFVRNICYDPASDEPNGIFSAPEFIAAWVHMRQIFAAEGATNVVWLWNPSGSNHPIRYYPGPAHVDWIGFDKYDDAGVSFAQTYGQAYAWLAPLNKPMLLGETGVTAAIQPTYFSSAVSTLRTQFPLIKGYVYFDAVGNRGDWVISGPGLNAFKTMAADPYFSAAAP